MRFSIREENDNWLVRNNKPRIRLKTTVIIIIITIIHEQKMNIGWES
jgi:hypothetical protein